MTIWLVEDDENIRELVAYTLRAAGYQACAFEAAGPLDDALAAGGLPDLFLLDIMLPGEDGLSILKRLRAGAATARLPVIMLTAKSQEYDKVLGLDAGADDYLAKPFGMMELVSRIKAVLRRAGTAPAPEKGAGQLNLGALSLNPKTHTVLLDAAPVELTLKEFELLQHLLENPGLVHTRDMLLDAIWGYRYEGGTRTVDVHIRSLRLKLEPWSARIQTVRGVGYKLGEPL